ELLKLRNWADYRMAVLLQLQQKRDAGHRPQGDYSRGNGKPHVKPAHTLHRRSLRTWSRCGRWRTRCRRAC
ncbi:MAG TPA: hypothetical protein VJS65_01140, partial [Verrucomicrobiae bacterium]|nr:hypothetical protein [Verrucomicrobiae bacterium]